MKTIRLFCVAFAFISAATASAQDYSAFHSAMVQDLHVQYEFYQLQLTYSDPVVSSWHPNEVLERLGFPLVNPDWRNDNVTELLADVFPTEAPTPSTSTTNLARRRLRALPTPTKEPPAGEWDKVSYLYLTFGKWMCDKAVTDMASLRATGYADIYGKLIATAADAGVISYVLTDDLTNRCATFFDQVVKPLVPAAKYNVDWIVVNGIGGPYTVWMRDYGPFFYSKPFTKDNPTVRFTGVVDAKYYTNRPDDDIVPKTIADAPGYKLPPLPYETWDLKYEGGNFLSNGGGLCLASDVVTTVNGAAASEAAFKDKFGCVKLLILKRLRDVLATGHVDMYISWIDRYTAFVGEYSLDQDAVNAKIMNDNAAIIAALKDPLDNTAIKVIRMKMPSNCPADPRTLIAPIKCATVALDLRVWRTYLNVVQLNKKVVVPVFKACDRNEAAALKQWADAGFTVVTVPADGIIYQKGAVHCITKTRPVILNTTATPSPTRTPTSTPSSTPSSSPTQTHTRQPSPSSALSPSPSGLQTPYHTLTHASSSISQSPNPNPSVSTSVPPLPSSTPYHTMVCAPSYVLHPPVPVPLRVEGISLTLRPIATIAPSPSLTIVCSPTITSPPTTVVVAVYPTPVVEVTAITRDITIDPNEQVTNEPVPLNHPTAY